MNELEKNNQKATAKIAYDTLLAPAFDGWISVEENRPEYGQSVLVCRPNKYSGKTDILIAKYHKAKEEGTEYGSGNGMGGGYCRTFKDYWSLPAIVVLNSITFWMPLPEPKCVS